MPKHVAVLSVLTVCALAAAPASTRAALAFPDVPDTHPHGQAIRQLALTQVVRGNADGLFRPEDRLNRADFLVMLYRALNRAPAEPEKICFPDVVAGAYYEAAVCHAVRQQFVGGYPDRSFKPGNPVSRAEAVKMLMRVMEFDLTLRAAKDVVPPPLVDVPSGQWFTAPVHMAYAYGILPLKGWEGFSFHPGTPITRAEAASLIWNGLEARRQLVDRTASSSSAGSSLREDHSSAGGSSSTVGASASSARSTSSSLSAATAPVFKTVTFPFTEETGGRSVTHQFTVASKTAVDVWVSQLSGRGPVSCTLSALDKDGFSLEYYTGYQEGRTCAIRAFITPGTYQLRTQTPDPESSFSVAAKTGVSTGNDGFSQAKDLLMKPVRTEWMNAGDLQDFYAFSVTGLKKGEEGRSMTLRLVSEGLRCMIFPLANVDLSGFNGPACGSSYVYPAGSYVVVIGRDPKLTPSASRQTYTIQLVK